MERKLLFYPNSELKRKAEPIVAGEFSSAWIVQLVLDMKHIMQVEKGVGLAAVQIGANKSIVIYKDQTGIIHVLCNAKIAKSFGKVISKGEGCLSVPGFNADIERAKGVKVKAQTIDGKPMTVKERGFQAIILQHEIDHLNGTEFIDYISSNNKEKQTYLKSLEV